MAGLPPNSAVPMSRRNRSPPFVTVSPHRLWEEQVSSSDSPASPMQAPTGMHQNAADGTDANGITDRERRNRSRGLSAAAQNFGLVACWGLMILGFGLRLGSTFLSWSNFGEMFSS